MLGKQVIVTSLMALSSAAPLSQLLAPHAGMGHVSSLTAWAKAIASPFHSNSEAKSRSSSMVRTNEKGTLVSNTTGQVVKDSNSTVLRLNEVPKEILVARDEAVRANENGTLVSNTTGQVVKDVNTTVLRLHEVPKEELVTRDEAPGPRPLTQKEAAGKPIYVGDVNDAMIRAAQHGVQVHGTPDEGGVVGPSPPGAPRKDYSRTNPNPPANNDPPE